MSRGKKTRRPIYQRLHDMDCFVLVQYNSSHVRIAADRTHIDWFTCCTLYLELTLFQSTFPKITSFFHFGLKLYLRVTLNARRWLIYFLIKVWLEVAIVVQIYRSSNQLFLLSTMSRVRVRRLFYTLLLSLLMISFIVATVPSTLCPVTSPIGEQVYVSDTPSKIVLGATRSQCTFECVLSDKISGLSEGRHPGCRCFNYNSTSANCSLFMFEPTNYGVDQQGDTVAYQVMNLMENS